MKDISWQLGFKDVELRTLQDLFMFVSQTLSSQFISEEVYDCDEEAGETEERRRLGVGAGYLRSWSVGR